MVKRVSMLFFETFVQKQNDNLLLETQKEGSQRKIKKSNFKKR